MRTTLDWIVVGALVLVGAVTPVRAQTDMTGTFYVVVNHILTGPPSLCTMTFSQVGTSLTASGCGLPPTPGTLDSTGSAFVLDVQDILGDLCGDLSGTVTNGGADFTAGWTLFSSLTCDASLIGRQHCHNGVVDPGEQCDPGNVPSTACCSQVCTAAPAGTTCSDGDPCTVDACDGTGSCIPSPPSGCIDPLLLGSPLVVKDDALPSRDLGSWKFTHGPASSPGDFGDPRAATGYRLCVFAQPLLGPPVYDHTLLRLEVAAGGTCPSGDPCWKATKNGFRYRSRPAASNGVELVDLKAGVAGHTKLTFRAKGPTFALPALPLDVPLLVQLQAGNGRCWEAEYTGPRTNTSTDFRAKGAAPAP